MRAINTTMWRDIFIEDVFIFEGIQRRHPSGQYDGSQFLAVMDVPKNRFHKWVAMALSG